jgi:hypothetical protein
LISDTRVTLILSEVEGWAKKDGQSRAIISRGTSFDFAQDERIAVWQTSVVLYQP